MRASAPGAEKDIARLRRRIAEIEGRFTGLVDGGKVSDSEGLVREIAPLRPRRGAFVPLGIAPLDEALGGGLRQNALHEVRGALPDIGAATGFAAALLSLIPEKRPILWIFEASSGREGGLPYGPGLARFGLDPGRLIVVRVRRPGEALWVLEEGLRCRGLAAAFAEIRGSPRKLDLTASRRLALRASESGVTGLLLRQSGAAEPGAALTRWHVAPRPSAISRDFPAGIGPPAWHLVLERNRSGVTGVFDLEWDHGNRCFVPAILPALPFARPAAPANRPDPQAAPGKIVAHGSRRAA
jgi:protein ImuA